MFKIASKITKILAIIALLYSPIVPISAHLNVEYIRSISNKFAGKIASISPFADNKIAHGEQPNYCKMKFNLMEENGTPVVGQAHSCPEIFARTIYFQLKNGKIEQNNEQNDAFYLENGKMEESKNDKCKPHEITIVKEFKFVKFKNNKNDGETLIDYTNGTNEWKVTGLKTELEFAEIVENKEKIIILAEEGECFTKFHQQKLYNCPKGICHQNTFFFIDHNKGILYNLVPMDSEKGGDPILYKMLAEKCADDIHKIQAVDEYIPTGLKKHLLLFSSVKLND